MRADFPISSAPPATPPAAPVVCLTCLQVVADAHDVDLAERLQAHRVCRTGGPA